MGSKKVTFDDIARHTGFSKTTISRFFNNPGSLTRKNQEIIRNALTELNYKENKVAQILATGETDFVGILVPNLMLHYYSEMLNQILLTYPEYGYKYIVFVGSEDPQVEQDYIQKLLSYQIAGLIVMSHSTPSAQLAALSIPIVSIEREDIHICSVNSDNYTGALLATELLQKNGCDIFIHINTPTPITRPAYQRINGFRDYCTERGLRHELFIRETGTSASSITAAMLELFNEIENRYPGQKKGIFFSDDTRANAFLNVLLRKYHVLPEEYRLVGFDNSPIAEQAGYPISTVGQQIRLIAHETVALLHEKILEYRSGADWSAPPVHRVITPMLYPRATTDDGGQ